MSVDTTTKVNNPIVNLNLLNKHIDECNAVINNELLRGDKADTTLLMRMLVTVTSYMHNNETVLNRQQLKIHSDRIEEEHPSLVNMKKNTTTQFLHSASGTVNAIDAIFRTTILIFAAATGQNPDNIAMILKAPEMIFRAGSAALDGFAKASGTKDQAVPMPLEHKIQVLQREISELQSLIQNSKGHETETMRMLKEVLEAMKNHLATVMRASSSN